MKPHAHKVCELLTRNPFLHMKRKHVAAPRRDARLCDVMYLYAFACVGGHDGAAGQGAHPRARRHPRLEAAAPRRQLLRAVRKLRAAEATPRAPSVPG